MLLNAGCGEHYAPGWVNIDLHHHGPRPDIVCSLLALPFADDSCERVYCGHVLEHIAVRDLPCALSEIKRVLTPGGQLMVVGPDANLTRRFEPALLDGAILGAHRWPGDEHRWTATGDRTLCHLLAAGFDAHLTSLADIPKHWPVLDRAARWQFAIAAHPTLKEP